MGTNRSKRSAKTNGQGPESAGGNSADQGRKFSAGRNAGRHSETAYLPEFAHRAKLLCQKGATGFDLAIAFGVRRSTIFEWQAFHEDFAAACKVDRVVLDNRVEESLAERAIGYEYPEEEARQVRGQVLKVSLRKHMPADVSALKFLLANRKPKEWSTHPEPKPDVEGNPLARLYEAVCGTKLMPNEDQTAWLEREDYPGQRKNNAGEQPKAIDPENSNED